MVSFRALLLSALPVIVKCTVKHVNMCLGKVMEQDYAGLKMRLLESVFFCISVTYFWRNFKFNYTNADHFAVCTHHVENVLK